MEKILTTFCIVLLFCFSSHANDLRNVRSSHQADFDRVVFDFQQTFKYEIKSYSNSLVIILPNNIDKKNINFKKISEKLPYIKEIKWIYNNHQPNVIIHFKEKTQYKHFTLYPNDSNPNFRLVIDFLPPTMPTQKNNIIIAIDAGHGGKDPGSTSVNGINEKDVVLSISKKLAQKINKLKGFQAILIRKTDKFISLNERVKIARESQADFLISIHADSFLTREPNGASVIVLSNKRIKTELTRWLERNEKLTDPNINNIFSNNLTENENIYRTILDLTSQNSIIESIDIAHIILNNLRKIVSLHKEEVQYASLAILKALDIPSILLEAGFISNEQDEKKLISASFQERLTQSITQSIESYYQSHPIIKKH